MKNVTTMLALFVALSPAVALAVPLTNPSTLRAAGTIHLVHEGHKGATAASGVINAVDTTQRKVNVSHGSIKSLGWPAMTMDFPVNQDVDLSTVKAGMKVNFTLVKGTNGSWTVDSLRPSGN